MDVNLVGLCGPRDEAYPENAPHSEFALCQETLHRVHCAGLFVQRPGVLTLVDGAPTWGFSHGCVLTPLSNDLSMTFL